MSDIFSTSYNQVLEESRYINRVPASILLNLNQVENELYVAELREAVDTTYAHLVKQVSELEEDGLVVAKKKGRKKYVKPTKEGVKYAKVLKELVELESKAGDSENSFIKGK